MEEKGGRKSQESKEKRAVERTDRDVSTAVGGRSQHDAENLFAGTMEDMLKAELDAKLGYHKNDPAPKEAESFKLCKRSLKTVQTVHFFGK